MIPINLDPLIYQYDSVKLSQVDLSVNLDSGESSVEDEFAESDDVSRKSQESGLKTDSSMVSEEKSSVSLKENKENKDPSNMNFLVRPL